MRKIAVGVLLLMALIGAAAAKGAEITDGAGRKLDLPVPAERVICSGPGCLRLLVYLQAQGRVVAVDDIEKKRPQFDARPYALANPQFKDLPLFGEFRGHDNPKLIMALDPPPQVIFKTYPAMGHDPEKLQQKTGIPVVVLEYGDLEKGRPQLYQSLRLMGRIVDREGRAEEVIRFFESGIADLAGRGGRGRQGEDHRVEPRRPFP
jgi:iron complex transport system substrate-binding protein